MINMKLKNGNKVGAGRTYHTQSVYVNIVCAQMKQRTVKHKCKFVDRCAHTVTEHT